MVASISQIIGKVNPKLYAQNGSELLKKYGSIDKIPAEEVKPQAIKYSYSEKGFIFDPEGLECSHKLVYDSSSETLEPIYFFIIDLLNDRGLAPEKLVDNFSSTPGSGHFAELGQRATIMQQQAVKILGDVNTVLRSVLNIIDAFLMCKDEKDVDKIDLNDRVKRILKPRVQEFNIWLKESEKELRKRYELERTYLKSQVNSLKLYSRWVRPYLKAAQDLEAKEKDREPALVKTFNTILLELTVLGKNKLDIADEALKGNLPKD